MTLEQTVLDDIAEKIAGGLRLLGGVKDEAQAQVKAIVESALDGLDVVNDERMQVAEALLAKARGQIKEMEVRITALESRLKKKS
ncbi:MAG: accessory factor UbiK family protein [Mariprofundaceae bacterium]|nr:accessory factor UbiK family protein [Mariprofundaceae bacterium]